MNIASGNLGLLSLRDPDHALAGSPAAGKFLCGLSNFGSVVRLYAAGRVIGPAGPYLETKEHVGGFWVLEAVDMNEALEWGRKAVVACRAPVEVRPFH
ncbi:MAG: YciI family protein [Planctomycetia bacterium]|nr:YciI family protein [Planctomycetia bacterium]